MKKLIISFIVTAALFSLTACQTLSAVFQEPVVTLRSAEVTNINLNGVQLLCKIQVENPNRFNIPFPETDWAVLINSNSFVSGTIKNDHRIGANSRTIVDIPVNLEYTGLFNSFKSLLGTRQIGYKVALGVKIPLPVLGDKVWNFEHSGDIPLPQLPQVSRPSVRMDNANPTRAIMTISMNVTNPNSFEIPAPVITYDYLLNRNSFIKGEIKNDGKLAPNAATPVTFQLTVTYADLFRSFSSLRNLYEVASLLIVTCNLGIPYFGSEPLRYEVAGTLPILR